MVETKQRRRKNANLPFMDKYYLYLKKSLIVIHVLAIIVFLFILMALLYTVPYVTQLDDQIRADTDSHSLFRSATSKRKVAAQPQPIANEEIADESDESASDEYTDEEVPEVTQELNETKRDEAKTSQIASQTVVNNDNIDFKPLFTSDLSREELQTACSYYSTALLIAMMGVVALLKEDVFAIVIYLAMTCGAATVCSLSQRNTLFATSVLLVGLMSLFFHALLYKKLPNKQVN